jgi:hypothetical protein
MMTINFDTITNNYEVIYVYCKPTYFKRRIERHFSSKMKRKSRDWDLTLELSCHAGCPTVVTDLFYVYLEGEFQSHDHYKLPHGHPPSFG